MNLVFVFAAYMEFAFVVVLSKMYTKEILGILDAQELGESTQSQTVSIDSCARLSVSVAEADGC